MHMTRTIKEDPLSKLRERYARLVLPWETRLVLLVAADFLDFTTRPYALPFKNTTRHSRMAGRNLAFFPTDVRFVASTTARAHFEPECIRVSTRFIRRELRILPGGENFS